MKKVLLIVAGVIGLAIVGVVGAASMQPDTMHVERHVTIAATPADVFPYANDLKKFADWNPWDAMDPNIKLTYSPTTAGVGAWYEWEGNDKVGKGKMSIKASEPDHKVVTDLDFIEPFASHAVATFTLVPEGASTKVTWGFDSDMNILSKTFSLFSDMDAMLGADFQRGLDSLKKVSETAAQARVEAEKAAEAAEAAKAAEAAAAMAAGGAPPAEGEAATGTP